MKRSEMLKIIKTYLDTELCVRPVYTGPGGAGPVSEASIEHSDYEANQLLLLIEKAGMSPPSMSIPTKAIFGDKEINVGNITAVRVWEPEHEKK